MTGRPGSPPVIAVTAWLLAALPVATLLWLRVLAARLLTHPARPFAAPTALPATAACPGISLVIIAWNGWEMTSKLLDSIQRQTAKPAEIILVDNGSDDGTATNAARAFPEVRVIRLPANTGFAPAANIGLQAAGGDTLILLNNDLTLADDFVARVSTALRQYPDDASFAVQLRYADTPEQLNAAGEIVYTSLLPDNRARGARWQTAAADLPVAGACAAAAVYRRELLAAIGLFEELFVMTYEDSDLSLRALRAGHSCRYLASAVAWHRQLATIGPRSEQHAYYTVKNCWHLLARHAPPALLIRQAGPAIAHRAWLLAAYAASGQARAAWRGCAAAWREIPLMTARTQVSAAAAARLRPWLQPLPQRRRPAAAGHDGISR